MSLQICPPRRDGGVMNTRGRSMALSRPYAASEVELAGLLLVLRPKDQTMQQLSAGHTINGMKQQPRADG